MPLCFVFLLPLKVVIDSFVQVAIKTIKKSKIETEADLIRIRREIQIMSSVQHPNIIHIYEGDLVLTFTALFFYFSF